MKVIDSDNYADSGIETMFFPGGEPHARIPIDFGPALLYLKARTWNDVGLALVVMDALLQQQRSHEFKRIWLFCPYFPGARQDRTDGQTPHTAKLMLNMLAPYTDRVFTFDAHSDVIAEKVYHNFMPSDLPINKLFTNPPPRIIIPDAGALKRCLDFNSMFNSGYGDLVQCEKHRDFATGKFTGFEMPALRESGTYLIVDDICDGGGTFNLLAEEFAKDPVSKYSHLQLWVSHGIFSKGLTAISPVIERIYTTNSFTYQITNPYHDPRLNVVSLQPIIDEILESERVLEEYKNV